MKDDEMMNALPLVTLVAVIEIYGGARCDVRTLSGKNLCLLCNNSPYFSLGYF